MKLNLIAARGSQKTSTTLNMVSRLAEGKCICCDELVSEGQEICIKCEKCIDAICENGSAYPLTATELEFIRMNANKNDKALTKIFGPDPDLS